MKKVLNKVFSFISSVVALISLFAVSFLISSSLTPSSKLSNNSDEIFFNAVAITILVTFIYLKLAKKFNL